MAVPPLNLPALRDPGGGVPRLARHLEEKHRENLQCGAGAEILHRATRAAITLNLFVRPEQDRRKVDPRSSLSGPPIVGKHAEQPAFADEAEGAAQGRAAAEPKFIWVGHKRESSSDAGVAAPGAGVPECAVPEGRAEVIAVQVDSFVCWRRSHGVQP